MSKCPDGDGRNKSKQSKSLFNKCCKKEHDPSQINCLMTEEDEKRVHAEIKLKSKTELKPKTKEKPKTEENPSAIADYIKEIEKEIPTEREKKKKRRRRIKRRRIKRRRNRYISSTTAR